MNLSQKQLKMFVTLANVKNFSRASVSLHMSQPSLSRSIRELEYQIGAELFTRDTRHIALSEAGKLLLPHAQQLLRDLESVASDLQKQQAGVVGKVTVAVGSAFGSVMLPNVVARMREKNPGVCLQLIDDTSGGVVERVLASEADVGICSPVGDLSGMTLHRLLSAPVGCLAHPGHFKLDENSSLEDIGSLPLLLEPDGTSIMSILRARGHEMVGLMQGGVEVCSLAIELGLVQAGVAVAVISALGASHPGAHGMRFIPLLPGVDREIFLVVPKRRKLALPGEFFVEQLTATLADKANLPKTLHPLVRVF